MKKSAWDRLSPNAQALIPDEKPSALDLITHPSPPRVLLLAAGLTLLRERASLTQAQLATKLGCSQSWIAQLESKDKWVSRAYALRIIEAVMKA